MGGALGHRAGGRSGARAPQTWSCRRFHVWSAGVRCLCRQQHRTPHTRAPPEGQTRHSCATQSLRAFLVFPRARHPTLTESNVTWLGADVLCDVTARPASRGEATASVTLDPATGVQATPSADVYAVSVDPETLTRRYAGGCPASDAAVTAWAPAAPRYWTITPWPGVT